MAEIVGSLFGVTPEDYQQTRQAQADKMALDFAKLDPFQSARFAIGRGAYGLAGAFGGALGAEDPELQIISRRQAIARQINPTDLNSMQMGVQALAQSGDQVGAMQLAQVLRQAENDIALRSQRQAAAMASTAQAGKTEQEMAEIKRQQEAYRRFKEGQQVETAAPSAAAAPANAITAGAVVPETSIAQNLSSFRNTPPIGTKDIFGGQLSQEDKQRIEQYPGIKDLYETYSQNAAFFLNTPPDDYYYRNGIYLLAEQAKKLSDFTGVKLPGTVEELRQVLNIGQPAAQPAAQPAPAAAPVTTAMIAPAAQPAAAAAAAAPVSQAPSDIAAQLRALETRYDFLKSLSKVPDAQNEAAGLERRMAVLRDQLKPADVGQEREALSLQDYNKRYSQLTTAERETVNKKIADAKTQSFGADRESVALELYDKPFLQLTTAQRAIVNKRVDEEQNRRARSGAATFPGDKALADIPAFRRAVQQTIDPQLKTIYAARQALQSINDSIATNNFVSFNAARTQLARSLGDSQLSRRDIEQAGGDPSILGGLVDVTSRAFTSTPSIDTQKKIRDTLQAIQTVARRQARGEVDQQRRIALRSPGYNAEAVNEALTFPELQEVAPQTGSAAQSVADQARAELARRQSGGR